MSACTDSTTNHRKNCGQQFGGELQHCVARVSWSEFPDGLAHVTASLSVIERLWSLGFGPNGSGELANPAIYGYEQDERGRWRMPMTDDERDALTARYADGAE